ncbi:MAG: GNAT family N-acetyltransferase [Xanthomonadaceae bacterium]|nr:GNAT family N-acetyltransferase [Xanthomonadaceae bacterium]
MALTVRQARAEDAADIARLSLQLDASLDPTTIAQRFTRLLAWPTHAFFVLVGDDEDDGARGGGPVVGFVAAEHRNLLQSGERVELIALVVDAERRRRGAGAALVSAAEAWASRRGVAQVVVRSSLSRDATHPFYRCLGYAHHKTQHVYTRSLSP